LAHQQINAHRAVTDLVAGSAAASTPPALASQVMVVKQQL
jgi:hypothetical protein